MNNQNRILIVIQLDPAFNNHLSLMNPIKFKKTFSIAQFKTKKAAS
jgi:hypothetical protein